MVFLTLVVISIFGYIISHAVIFDEIPAGINFFFLWCTIEMIDVHWV